MQVPLFWVTVFVNILQLSFSIYFFLIWTWLFDRQTLVSVYIQRNPALRPPRLYDHLLPQLTSHSLSTQTWKSPSHFIILKTSLMRPPRYHDQDFMTQRWSHQRGSTVLKLIIIKKRQRFTHFLTENMANRLNYKKFARLEGWLTLRFSVGTLRVFHWTKIPVWNFGKTTCPVEGTFQLQRPNQSHREFGYRACKQDTDQWSWGK